MAEIQIEKKSGPGVWAWLIPLLLVAAVLWWLFARNDDGAPAVAASDTAAAVTGDTTMMAAGDVGAADGTTITDVGAIAGASDRMALVGRRVQLTGDSVLAVVGDETFWVGSGETQRLFVTLDPAPSTGTVEESPADVNAGQHVTVAGVLRRVPADLAEWRTRWQMDDATAEALTTGQVYLAADRVAIAQPR